MSITNLPAFGNKAITLASNTSVEAGADEVSYMWVLINDRYQRFRNELRNKDLGKIVRRPIGIEWNDARYAYIEVIKFDDKGGVEPILLFNENHKVNRDVEGFDNKDLGFGLRISEGPAGAYGDKFRSGFAPYTNNFLVQGFNEVREEKYQLLETFGDNFVFFFGERPRLIDITGTLVDSGSHNWLREWWLNYEDHLRGTKAAQSRAIVNLHIDGVLISGYILTASAQKDATQPRKATFSFRMLVTDYKNIKVSGQDGLHPFFQENLRKFRNTPNQASGFVEFVRDSADIVDGYANIAGMVTEQVTNWLFGSTVGAMSSTIAMAASIYTDIASTTGIGDLEVFAKAGLGTLVEVGGKPIDLLPVDETGTTLRERGIERLVGSVDNSVEMLLNFNNSPLVHLIEGLGSLITDALRAFGVDAPDFRSKKLDDFRQRRGVLDRDPTWLTLSGSWAGIDFTIPYGSVIKTINPPITKNTMFEDIATGEMVSTGLSARGSEDKYQFREFPLVVRAGVVDFDELKKVPEYGLLPRTWRLQIEKDPANMSKKILASSRPNSDSEPVLILRVSKGTDRLPSTITNLINAA